MKKFELNQQYGYYEVLPKPTPQELHDYYREKYYQDEHATYARHYDDEEISYFNNKIEQKDYIVSQLLNDSKTHSLLDIGCGEGFTLNYYHENEWDVTGIDFSTFGLKENHSHLTDKLIQGNIFDEIQKLVQSGQQYDLVWLDNVLEHVIDPEGLIQECHQLTKEGGILVIEVPNDYSRFQTYLMKQGKVKRKYWEAYPDHLSYFSYNSLINLCVAQGWKNEKVISDFPIEWFLANENSNYINKSEVGKAAHKSRMFIENFLSNSNENDFGALIEFYEALAKVGQGRQLIGFFSKA